MKSLVLALALLSFASAAFALGCNPGTSECFNDTAYQSCNQQALWGAPIDCPAGWQCLNGACEEPIGCEPGTRKCTSGVSYKVCGNYAIWDPEQACAAGATCSNGQCIFPPQCSTPGITRCAPDSSNNVQVCNANLQWETLKYCDYGCNSGYCRSCTPNAARCADYTHIQGCGSDGNWGPTSYCGDNNVCSSGSCIPNPAINCQSIGAYRCSPSGSSTLQRCGSNYQWSDYQYCTLGCFYSSCRACSTGQTKCKDSATYYSCTQQGQWGLETSCPTGYICFSGSCQVLPGTTCKAVGEKRCSPESAKGCFDGMCAECTPGASMCSGASTYRTCSQNGQLSGEKTCAAGTTCEDGTCVATHVCSEGQRQCISGSIYSCTSGNWQLLYICPQDNDCKEEQGTAYCVPEVQPAPTPAPAPAPAPQPAKEEPPLGSLGILFMATTLLLAGVAYYLYSKKRR